MTCCIVSRTKYCRNLMMGEPDSGKRFIFFPVTQLTSLGAAPVCVYSEGTGPRFVHATANFPALQSLSHRTVDICAALFRNLLVSLSVTARPFLSTMVLTGDSTVKRPLKCIGCSINIKSHYEGSARHGATMQSIQPQTKHGPHGRYCCSINCNTP